MFVALASKSESNFTKFKFEPNIYFGSAYGGKKLFFTNNKLCRKVSGRPYHLLYLRAKLFYKKIFNNLLYFEFIILSVWTYNVGVWSSIIWGQISFMNKLFLQYGRFSLIFSFTKNSSIKYSFLIKIKIKLFISNIRTYKHSKKLFGTIRNSWNGIKHVLMSCSPF